MSRVLVTGGSGYIGGFLIDSLVKDNHCVVVLVRKTTDLRFLKKYDSVRTVLYDGTAQCVLNIISKEMPSVVYHLAATGGAEHAADDLVNLIESNITLGLQILEGLNQVGCGCFVNTGTFWQHYDGTKTYYPTSLYSATKQAFQDILSYYSRVLNIPTCTLILYDVYGTNDQRKRILSLIIDAYKSKITLQMSAGEQQLNLVYIDDVVRAFRCASDLLLNGSESAVGKTYYVCHNKSYKLRDVVKTIEQCIGAKVSVIWGAKPYRRGEVMIPFLGEVLPGWQPEITLEKGVGFLLESSSNLER